MNIKCVISCHNASGSPDFYFCIVNCSESDYDLGNHYDIAESSAKEQGYEGPFVVYDEKECPDWLLERFVWESASVVKENKCSCVNADHIRIFRQHNPDQCFNPDPNVQYYEIDACNSLVVGNYSDECWTIYNGKLIDKETAIKIVPEFCKEIGRPDLADKIKFWE